MSAVTDRTVVARLMFEAVRASMTQHGGDVTQAPFDKLDPPSKEMWLTAWDEFAGLMVDRGLVFIERAAFERMAMGSVSPIAT